MKNTLLLLLCISAVHLSAQSVVYTHRTTRLFVSDGVIVGPEIGSMNHLWIVTPKMHIRLQVYDHNLEWKLEKILPFNLTNTSDVTVLPFNNEYFLYNQTEAGNSKFLWRIDNNGNATDVSRKLKAIIKTSFNDSTVVCQLFSKGSNIFLMGHVYYPSLKKIITTLIQTSTQLEQSFVKRFAFNFDHLYESLQRMLVTPEGHLIILKENITEDLVQELNVVKIDLNTKISAAVFKSERRLEQPELIYNSFDSSTTLCAYATRSEKLNRIFFSTLNDTLAQKLPPINIRVPIAEEMYGAFASVTTGSGGARWLPVYGVWNTLYDYNAMRRVLVGLSAMVTLAGNKMVVMGASSYQPKLQAIDPYRQNIAPPGNVRFSVVNLKSRNAKDTTIKYYRRSFIEVSQYASFSHNSNNYLVVKEKFRSNGKGILLLSTNKDDKLIPFPLHVYERFHYAIPQLQQTGKGSLMIPYVYKREVGLVRVLLNDQ